MSATSTILAAASIAASVAGTGMTMMGQQQQARAQAASARYQAAVARNNQQVAEWQAQDALERGREREKLKRLETAARLGKSRTAAAGKGVIVDEDSMGTITEDIAEFGELDALNEAANAEREAYSLRVRAQNFSSEAALLDTTASNQIAAGRMAMMSTAISGVGTVSGKWAGYKKEGIF